MRFYSSTIGKKIIMAVTGLLMLGFVVAHLIGNLQIFISQEKFNAYAAFLKSIPGPLWVARILLLLTVGLHFITAFQLRSRNKQARTINYKDMSTVKADPASLYMIESGIVIFIFIVIHLLHFTFGKLQSEFYQLHDEAGRHDVYRIVIAGFQNGPYSYIYIFAMLALGLHLRHAFWSMFQTVGVYSPSLTPCLKNGAKVAAGLVTLGYISIPLSVLLGILK